MMTMMTMMMTRAVAIDCTPQDEEHKRAQAEERKRHRLEERERKLHEREEAKRRRIDEMAARGWGVQPQFGYHGSEANVHISIGQKTFDQTAEFLAALRESVEACRPKGFSQTAAKVKAELSRINVADFKPAMMSDFMRAAGIEDGQLPRKSAELNQILNVLPPHVTAFALREFMNERYVYREKK